MGKDVQKEKCLKASVEPCTGLTSHAKSYFQFLSVVLVPNQPSVRIHLAQCGART